MHQTKTGLQMEWIVCKDPFFLVMTLPVLLHGYQWFWLGPDGWKWLGLAISGAGIWVLSEKILGKFK